MSNTYTQDWRVANHRYLLAALHKVKEELEFYAANVNVNTSFEVSAEAQLAFEEAAKGLNGTAALAHLVRVFNLTNFEWKILLLCAGVELSQDFQKFITNLQNDQQFVYPSFNLASAAFTDAHWSAISPASPLRYWNLIQLQNNALLAKSPLIIDEQILHYLTGFSYMDERLRSIIKPVEQQAGLVVSQQQIADAIAQTYVEQQAQTNLPFIQLEGNIHSDKLDLAAAMANSMGHHLYQISVLHIPEQQEQLQQLTRLWNREAALNAYALFVDATELKVADKAQKQALSYLVENINGVLIVGNEGWNSALQRPKLSFQVEKPTRAEQLQLWNAGLGKAAEAVEDYLKQVVAHFDLSAKTIREVVAAVQRDLPPKFRKTKSTIASLEKNIWKHCCHYTRPKVDELAKRIVPVATWEDIILPKIQKDTLREIAQQVQHRSKVYEEWGFRHKSSRGFGISALFTGPSGTGKTMAAEVLASELQLDLYSIDLSQVVNKYIGETEKNLKRIFDAAEEGGAILVFNEADALFGKRSEVKDGLDRHNNIEVSYLLERMESYRGLAVLTTNLKSAIDQAFLRRIRFVVNFARPDAALRREIWKGVFPKQTPTKNLDYNHLAQLNIPGGNIKNVAMNAAFLAAAQSEKVSMGHVLHAARNEYQKIEKTLSRNEIKDWI